METINKPTENEIQDNENNEKVLENQLHQQLAENDNNRISTFITFIVGIIALFGFYGYVYVYTNSCKHPEFNIEVFLLMSIVTIGILCFFSMLALYLGYSFRRDQLIVHNIRVKRYEESKKDMDKIFGIKYSSTEKKCCLFKKKYSQNENLYSPLKKNFCNFLPDSYNLFYLLFFASEIFLGIITIRKVKYFIVLFIIFIFIFLTFIRRLCYYIKYKKNISPKEEQEQSKTNKKEETKQ